MIRLAVAIALANWPAVASATEIEVDVELALMVDVSRSMSPQDLEIQRRCYSEPNCYWSAGSRVAGRGIPGRFLLVRFLGRPRK